MPPGSSDYGVYVHLPWCESRCHYCNFNVHVDPHRDEARYTDALLRQWGRHQPLFSGRPSTLSFGGGTPSLHPVDQLSDIISAIAPTGEVSLEANPSSTTPEKLAGWRAAGVTRLSIGLQTTSERHRRFLNRRHSAADAQALVREVAAAGFESWSLDLIFALPAQDRHEVDAELDRVLELDPPHLSLYGLTVEPGTALAAAVDRGQVVPADDDRWVDLQDRVVHRLQAAGMERYEVSNFARPGHRCAHNSHYWRGRDYAGLGVGAHGLLPDGRRTVGHADPSTFIAAAAPWATAEHPTPRSRLTDYIISTLRHRDGVCLRGLAARGGTVDLKRLERRVPIRALVLEEAAIRLGAEGWNIADRLALEIDRCVESSDSIANSDGVH